MDHSPEQTNVIIVIFLVHIQPGRVEEYRIYERQVEAILSDHGGSLEQSMAPYATAGAIATPDEVQVMSFPDQAALAAYQSDPRMQELRSKRDSAVNSTFMILGRPV